MTDRCSPGNGRLSSNIWFANARYHKRTIIACNTGVNLNEAKAIGKAYYPKSHNPPVLQPWTGIVSQIRAIIYRNQTAIRKAITIEKEKRACACLCPFETRQCASERIGTIQRGEHAGNRSHCEISRRQFTTIQKKGDAGESVIVWLNKGPIDLSDPPLSPLAGVITLPNYGRAGSN